MTTKQPMAPSNRLLSGLPATERDRFLADCKKVNLILGDVIYEQGDSVRYVYFPTESYVSMLTTVDRDSTLEVGMIGNEGMCGFTMVQGIDIAPLRGLVQGAGSAWRMNAKTFRVHLESLPALHRLLDRYVYVLLGQLAQTAACTRFHVVEKRLARWLLMTQDRAHSESFDMTQEFLAHMLGVRRVGVTNAASILQAAKLIHYTRGHITILNRGRLEAAACACYSTDLETYRSGMNAHAKR